MRLLYLPTIFNLPIMLVLVHEWAKLRWGVFEEYGYPGDDRFPMFYFETTWTSSGQQDTLRPNLCTDTEVAGAAVDITTGGNCTYDISTGMPDSNCYFIPDKNTTIKRFTYFDFISDLNKITPAPTCL